MAAETFEEAPLPAPETTRAVAPPEQPLGYNIGRFVQPSALMNTPPPRGNAAEFAIGTPLAVALSNGLSFLSAGYS